MLACGLVVAAASFLVLAIDFKVLFELHRLTRTCTPHTFEVFDRFMFYNAMRSHVQIGRLFDSTLCYVATVGV